MEKRRKSNRKFLALLSGMVMLLGSVLQPLSEAVLSRAVGIPIQNRIIHRVMDEQTGSVQHYHYEDADGNVVEPGTAMRQNIFFRKRAAKSDLPESYDPRGTESETPIRDQLDTGACWAFGALKSLEGNAIAQGLYTAEEADFSENHLAWYTYQPLQDNTNSLYGDYLKLSDSGSFGKSESIYDQGGNALMAAFTLANGWGAAAEEDAPFMTGAAMTKAMEPLGDSIREQSVMRLTSAECYDGVSLDEIKQAVMDHKAMDVSLYYPATPKEEKELMYQDAKTCSLYNTVHGVGDANHCVTIVGWDDHYDTFAKKPEQSGAWLIANSYGEEYNDSGYFWVSYYDTSLCDYYTFQGVSADTYAQTFQYDGMGWDDALCSDQNIRFANVFTNETSQPQEISAASFYTLVDDQQYEVQLYRNLGTSGPLDGEWVGRCTTEGTAGYAGYHTVSLQQPIIVAPGERFSIIVTFDPKEGETYVPIEGENSMKSDTHHSGKAGQSYFFLEEENQWYDSVEAGLNNVCLKALANSVTEEVFTEQEKTYEPSIPTPEPATPTSTVQQTSQPDLSQTLQPNGTDTRQPSGNEGGSADSGTGTTAAGVGDRQKTVITGTGKVTMGVGEKVRLKISISPKQTISYQSSNTKVAAVKKNGVVVGKKTGTAKITASASGVQKKVTVRVKKAPKSVKLTAGKKTLKKGKTCKLKVHYARNSVSYSLKYKSMNPGIASVSSAGKVKAKKKGTAKIRVKTFNGKKAYIKIKVVS